MEKCDKIDVINNDPVNGLEIEKGCTIKDILPNGDIVVILSSDDSIECICKNINGSWEIVENL